MFDCIQFRGPRLAAVFFGVLFSAAHLSAEEAKLNQPPAGFTALFNGTDLAGWHGMSTVDPRGIAKLSAEERKAKFDLWTADAHKHWSVQNGELVNDGNGEYLTSDKEFTDYEFLIDYKTVPKADSGIYLKATPQVQIWDSTETSKFNIGADKGSGGLWNNSAGAKGKDPLVLADKPFGEWNSFRIMQLGATTSVWLNGKPVVEDAVLENYFDRKLPLIAKGPIQLQTHGGEIRWRNVFVREIKSDEANQLLRDGMAAQPGAPAKGQAIFNGRDLTGWQGAVDDYEVVDGSNGDGAIRCKAGKGGNLFTKDEFANFVVRIEFKLPPGGNNGLALRYPGKGNPAYDAMCELQVLDTEHPMYASIDPRQAHGSVYGMIAAQRGYLRPTGEWNYQEVTVDGPRIKAVLNGNVILEGDVSKVTETMANSPHPGKDLPQGFFGFAGHSDPVEFRRIAIQKLP